MKNDWRNTTLNPQLALKLRNLNQDLPVATKNSQSLVAEMLEVARSYYNNRYRWDSTLGKYVPVFSYRLIGGTALDPTFQLGTYYLDCSTFVGLVLRGVPVQTSPYGNLPQDVDSRANLSDNIADDTVDIGAGDENCDGDLRPLPSDMGMYPWAMDLDNLRTNIESDVPYWMQPIRVSSQFAKYLVEHGRVVDVNSDLSNIEPGDLIFWAQRDGDTYTVENRYENINNVSICFSKEYDPKNVNITNMLDCTATLLNADSVQQYLDTTFGSENAVYKCVIELNSWVLYKRGPKVSGEWTWTNRTVVGDASQRFLDAMDIEVNLTYFNHDAHFEIVRYAWNANYPYKHVLLMANDSEACVTAPILEMCDVDQIALVCRPDLGSVSFGEYVGNLHDIRLSDIDYLYRPGIYGPDYGWEIQGLPESNVYNPTIKVEATQTASDTTTLIQTVWYHDTNTQYIRSQAKRYGQFSPTGWSDWQQVVFMSNLSSVVSDAVRQAVKATPKFGFVDVAITNDITESKVVQASDILPDMTSIINTGDVLVGSDGYLGIVSQVQLPNVTVIPTGKQIVSGRV